MQSRSSKGGEAGKPNYDPDRRQSKISQQGLPPVGAAPLHEESVKQPHSTEKWGPRLTRNCRLATPAPDELGYSATYEPIGRKNSS